MGDLFFNSYTLFKRHMSQPVNTYRDNFLKPHGQSGIDYYRGLQSSSETQLETKYSLHYDVLANQDIAFDLLHVSFLADREIQAEKIRAAVKSLPADFSDNRPGLENRGLFLYTKNTDKAKFLFNNYDEDFVDPPCQNPRGSVFVNQEKVEAVCAKPL